MELTPLCVCVWRGVLLFLKSQLQQLPLCARTPSTGRLNRGSSIVFEKEEHRGTHGLALGHLSPPPPPPAPFSRLG